MNALLILILGLFAQHSAPNAQEVDDCLSGSYVTSDNTCEPCQAGTFSTETNAQSCESCPEGYTSDAGSSECTPLDCLSGSYVTSDNTCEPCQAGTFSAEANAQSCEECPSGYTSDVGSAECTADEAVSSWTMELSSTFLDLSLSDWDSEYEMIFVENLASNLDVSEDHVQVLSVVEGSVVVESQIDFDDADEAERVYAAIPEVIFAEEFGTVETVASEPMEVVQDTEDEPTNPLADRTNQLTYSLLNAVALTGLVVYNSGV